MLAYIMASLVKSLLVKVFGIVNDRTDTYPQCSKLWTAAGAMSGPYGFRNSVPGHANPLQKHTE